MHITTSSINYDTSAFESKIISANTVLTRNIIIDFWLSIRMAFGGKLGLYADMVDKARAQVMADLEAQAQQIKAHSVVAVNIETNSIHPGTIEVLAYGTALIKK